MLQIHMYAQLAHGDIEIAWVFLVDPLTHTTVEGRLDIPRLSQCPFINTANHGYILTLLYVSSYYYVCVLILL